jgi:hypothetical protein
MNTIDIKHHKVVPCNPSSVPTYLTSLMAKLDSEPQVLQIDLSEVGILSPELSASCKYGPVAMAENGNTPQHGEVGCTGGEIQYTLGIGVQHPYSQHNDNWCLEDSHRKSMPLRYNHRDLPIATSRQERYHVLQAIF